MRLRVRFIFVPSGQFQSTHRVSDATKTVQDDITAHKFQSTHRVSDATKLLIRRSSISRISIHAPRERCDQVAPFAPFAPVFQSTHRVSDATFALDRFSFVFQFQSTHRVSDATRNGGFNRQAVKFQSTHRVSDATVNKKLKGTHMILIVSLS